MSITKTSEAEVRQSLSIWKGLESWGYDTLEEFLSMVNDEANKTIHLHLSAKDLRLEMWVYAASSDDSRAGITSSSRDWIMRLGNLIDQQAKRCYVPLAETPVEKPRVFIGHGGSAHWRDVKDHLHELHNYDVLAYETGARAGHAIRDVLEDMLAESSFAILVMTGEDQQADGTLRARQNVIHETGLFQGRLGFTKAIVLKEEGTEEFSNLNGIHQIRYSRGKIKETFGDVLATLKREFGM